MQIRNKRAGRYGERERLLLERFADLAAVAIRNARLFEQLLGQMGLYASRERAGGPAAVLAELEAPAREEELTVLVADLRGFTRLCQVAPSVEHARRQLSDFVSMLAETVVAHDGVVNKFLGDGLMALFRGEAHERRAVRCAFAMLAGFDRLKERWAA